MNALYRGARAVSILGAVGAISGCTPASQTVTLQSLGPSGAVSFVCVDDGQKREPRDTQSCYDNNLADGELRHLYSLVTQPVRGEVGVVDLSAGMVVDQDPYTPGYNLLAVGNAPVDIVSTPGSVASFVGVADPGREGIFALPTVCVSERTSNEPVRDITTWPACRLPSAPGQMTILIDPAIDTNGDGIPDVLRPSCGAATRVPIDQPDPIQTDPSGHSLRECQADLSVETDPPGRRKLVVALPDEGRLAIIDAQQILDRQPGSYDPCPIEDYVSLAVDSPPQAIPQRLPADFVVAPGDACTGVSRPAGLIHPPSDFSSPQPAGFAKIEEPGDHRLFIADTNEPVIHVFDTSDPCQLTAAPPLLPESYVDPTRVVTTRRLAVSPITTAGNRYLYAVDDQDTSGASVMMFDATAGASDRTPLLRPRSPLLPYEPPDRIAFDVPAEDVTFATVIPGGDPDPNTGTEGLVRCDPNRALPADDSAALYRPSSDFTVGARPGELRGTFGFVALTNGDIAVIDVDDLDAPCRRPIYTNDSATEDFRGCSSDSSLLGQYLTIDGSSTDTPTVTNEASCQTVEANRTRSDNLVINDPNVGIKAPSLAALPRLLDNQGVTLVTDTTVTGRQNPRMLAVNFSPSPADVAQVWVSSTLFQYQAGTAENTLSIDPTVATSNSLVLNAREPRAFVAQDDFHAIYEGQILGQRNAGVLTLNGNTATLTDAGIVFCDHGIDDERTAADRGVSELGVAPANASTFGKEHADFVRIVSSLLPETDPYWTGEGAECAGARANVRNESYVSCKAEFKAILAPENVSPDRDLRVISATAESLVVEPKFGGGAQVLGDITCCFPQTVSYAVRATGEWVVTGETTGFQHDVITNPDGTCGRDKCNPLKANLRSRAFEVSCDASNAAACPSEQVPIPNSKTTKTVGTLIGVANTDPAQGPIDVACTVTDPKDPNLETLGLPTSSPCIFQNLTTAFVIYRGTAPSVQDSEFDWEVLGGFSPLFINLVSIGDTNTNPRSISTSPIPGTLIVADGATKGIVLVDLATFALQPYF